MEEAAFRFGAFRLFTRSRQLYAGDSAVPLTDREFDILVFLLRNPQRAVTCDEIIAAVYQSRFVAKNNVFVQISKLRARLREAGEPAALINTEPGARYRFIGELLPPEPVARADPPEASEMPARPPPGRTGPRVIAASALLGFLALLGVWVIGAAISVPHAPARLSMLVKPFRYLGIDPARAYLADAITDDLTAELGHIPLSRIMARDTAVAVRDQTPDQIGRALGVRYIVEGSVVPQEGTIRVNASLIDASNGTQIWTAELDRSRIGDVSADIAIPIAARLRLTLNQIETARSVSDRPDDPNALDLFFRARSRLDSSGSPKDLAAAEALLQGALEKQPDFADAQAELAWLLLRKETTTDDPDEAHDDALAKELIAKALAASPQNSQALVARAKWLQTAGNCAQAQAFANRVLAIDGSSLRAHAVLAGCAYAGNNLDAAARAYEAMIALNPDGPSTRQINLALGYIYLMQGALAHARLAFDAAEDPDELPDPTEWNPLEQSKVGKIAALWLQGDHEAARRAYADYASKWPSRDVWRITMLFPRAWLANAGTQHLLDALHSAGMPLFVSESAPGRPDQVCGDGEFALTPTTLAGGRLLETAALRARLGSQPAPLILDVGHGGAVLERAVWRNPASSDQAAADFALQAAADHTGGSTRTPIIVAGDGPFGCDGFKAAQALLAHGYVDVGWYRGGEEAWHAAGAGGSDLRTQ